MCEVKNVTCEFHWTEEMIVKALLVKTLADTLKNPSSALTLKFENLQAGNALN